MHRVLVEVVVRQSLAEFPYGVGVGVHFLVPVVVLELQVEEGLVRFPVVDHRAQSSAVEVVAFLPSGEPAYFLAVGRMVQRSVVAEVRNTMMSGGC